MKPTFLATVAGVLLAVPFAQAEPSARSPNPLDPNAPVPALVHDSALRGDARPSAAASATPDQNWRPANDALAGSAGSGGQHAHGGHAPVPAPAAPAHGHHPAPGKQ